MDRLFFAQAGFVKRLPLGSHIFIRRLTLAVLQLLPSFAKVVPTLHAALTSARLYRRTFSHREAVAELRRHAATQFDPHLLEKFVKMLQTLFPESEFHSPAI